MPRFSAQVLNALSNPQAGMLTGQAIANVGSRLSQIPANIRAERERERLLKEQAAKKEAQDRLFAAYTSGDPSNMSAVVSEYGAVVPQTGMQVFNKAEKLSEQQEEEIKRTNLIKYVVNQLNSEGLEEVAKDVERGLYTNAQMATVLGNARQAKTAAEQGQAALVDFVNASDLSGTTFGKSVLNGELKNVPTNLISKIATEAINQRQTTELVKSLNSMNRPEATEAAELLELGVITDEGAKKLIVEGKKGPKISTSNMKQYVLDDGTVVWGGDITVDGDERKAYRDPQNPNNIVDLPVESLELKAEARIRGEDLRIASIQLAEDPKFSSLSAVDQEKAKVAFASKYNKLITEKKTNEQALAEAKTHTLSLIEQKTEENPYWFDTTVTTLKEAKSDPLGIR